MTTIFDNDKEILQALSDDEHLTAEAAGPDAREFWNEALVARIKVAREMHQSEGYGVEAISAYAVLGLFIADTVMQYAEQVAIKEEFRVLTGIEAAHGFDPDGVQH